MTTATSIEPCVATVDRLQFLRALERARGSASVQPFSGLDYVFLDTSGGLFRVVATDGVELTADTIPCERGVLFPCTKILRNTAGYLVAALQDVPDDRVDLLRAPFYFAAQWGPEADRRPRWFANDVGDRWMKWESVIPAHDCLCTASVSAWRAAIESLYPGRGTDIVDLRLTVGHDSETLVMTTASGEGRLPIRYQPGAHDANATIDLRRLRRWLKGIPARGVDVTAKFGAPDKPVVFESSADQMFVLMTLHPDRIK